MSALTQISLSETKEIVRTRNFYVRTLEGVDNVLRILQCEKFIGKIEIGLGHGGTPLYVKAEEKGKVQT